MAATKTQQRTDVSLDDYPEDKTGFEQYLHDVADDLFPFPGYRDYQDEILYESLTAMFINHYQNVIVDGPTGIGKSPINVTIARVMSHLTGNSRRLQQHFNYFPPALDEGNSFYTTPQKQLRNQLAEDVDLQQHLDMLKSRRDYRCNYSGENCAECSVKSDSEQSCVDTPGCTYWSAKERAFRSDIAVLTFAMLVVDNSIPLESEAGVRLSFDDRDLAIIDEGHNLEGQVASLFAGYSISSWSMPDEVWKNIDYQIDWNADRFEDVEEQLETVARRAMQFIERYENNPKRQTKVEQCENYLRKYKYCKREIRSGRPWVVTVSQLADTERKKKVEIKPVDVDGFLDNFVWSRADRRVISSATIPYRDSIETWTDRLGISGNTKLISKPMPFPEAHRTIHKNTIVGSMSGDDEQKNWKACVRQIKEIHDKHDGENGLIHTNSYQRAEKLGEALGDDAIVQEQDKSQDVQIAEWCESEKDILISPSMMQGVDLHGDRCRWQVLLKVPYPFVGDSRVSYLLNERNDWDWYMETASLDVQQSVGRAVRGPEPEEAASYYVIDEAFEKLMNRTNPPDWFADAIREDAPDHWDDGDAPWR